MQNQKFSLFCETYFLNFPIIFIFKCISLYRQILNREFLTSTQIH